MDARINEIAALTNAAVYDSESTCDCVDGSPHIKHPALRRLYGRLAVSVYDFAIRKSSTPSVLDLGSGEGSVTMTFLELGANVTAIDISETQLKLLKTKCARYGNKLDIRNEEIFKAVESLRSKGKKFDIIVANSFLHHIPDYLGLIREVTSLLQPQGQFFSFQDPLKYDSTKTFTRMFSLLAYFSWRIFKGDIIEGIKRRVRRSRGIYLDDCPSDNGEYHVTRAGVDQTAIERSLSRLGFECEIVEYFSTQNRFWQFVGTMLNLKNTFAVIGRRNS